MDTLFDYGLTPRAIAAIVLGLALGVLSQWWAYRRRAARGAGQEAGAGRMRRP